MREKNNNQAHPSLMGGGGGGSDDIASVILNGITFKGGNKGAKHEEQGKIKTKAKKKQYITGAHGSGSAKMKADIRKKRANRHK